MKNLKDYIVESVLDIDNNIDNVDESVKDQIRQFLEDNFRGGCKISAKPNSNGKYEVSTHMDVTVENKKITSFTNGMFTWVKVGGDFSCSGCDSLTSLEGAPKEVSGSFYCCNSLTSLEGAPERVGGDFDCGFCKSLTSLEGAPEEVGGDFFCRLCNSLTSLEGAPKEVGGNFDCSYCNSLTILEGAPERVGGNFDCSKCTSLQSLEGAPEEVGGKFSCSKCKVKFSEEDVVKISNVKGKIKVK